MYIQSQEVNQHEAVKDNIDHEFQECENIQAHIQSGISQLEIMAVNLPVHHSGQYADRRNIPNFSDRCFLYQKLDWPSAM